MLTQFCALIVGLQLTGAPMADMTPVRVSDADIRGAVRALQQEDWQTALHFTQEALENGARTSVRAAAYANRCIALYKMDQPIQAAEACEAALLLQPNNAVIMANANLSRTQLAAVSASATGN